MQMFGSGDRIVLYCLYLLWLQRDMRTLLNNRPINEAASHILKMKIIPLAHVKLFLIKVCAKYQNRYLMIQLYSWS